MARTCDEVLERADIVVGRWTGVAYKGQADDGLEAGHGHAGFGGGFVGGVP